eukprot:gnl/Dysnectes_brevis/7070_a11515_297.p1 GENE.gnl/Dysnectes_brevis/7070_a11515_297~~gnl/Dysnectes_brevis/7070_a11515_297.p1  ORF type:complete len:437 (+),score=25.25 gnl/Dysnectes_brevis/7070_a11515_297:164-1312(+)
MSDISFMTPPAPSRDPFNALAQHKKPIRPIPQRPTPSTTYNIQHQQGNTQPSSSVKWKPKRNTTFLPSTPTLPAPHSPSPSPSPVAIVHTATHFGTIRRRPRSVTRGADLDASLSELRGRKRSRGGLLDPVVVRTDGRRRREEVVNYKKLDLQGSNPQHHIDEHSNMEPHSMSLSPAPSPFLPKRLQQLLGDDFTLLGEEHDGCDVNPDRLVLDNHGVDRHSHINQHGELSHSQSISPPSSSIHSNDDDDADTHRGDHSIFIPIHLSSERLLTSASSHRGGEGYSHFNRHSSFNVSGSLRGTSSLLEIAPDSPSMFLGTPVPIAYPNTSVGSHHGVDQLVSGSGAVGSTSHSTSHSSSRININSSLARFKRSIERIDPSLWS